MKLGTLWIIHNTSVALEKKTSAFIFLWISDQDPELDSGYEPDTTTNGNSKLRVHFPPESNLTSIKILTPPPKKVTPFKKIKNVICCCTAKY